MKSGFDELKEFLKNDNFRKFLGIEVLEIDNNYAKVKGIVKKEHLNFHNVCHGAFIAALADFAFAIASNSDGKRRLAISIKIDFYKPAFEGEELVAEAKRIRGDKVAFFEMVVYRGKDVIAKSEGIVYRKD
ncbi:thioesterase [Archaeoglobales archaeon]|nr:MAG: thioesterase [Archaeoglobales archaeon]